MRGRVIREEFGEFRASMHRSAGIKSKMASVLLGSQGRSGGGRAIPPGTGSPGSSFRSVARRTRLHEAIWLGHCRTQGSPSLRPMDTIKVVPGYIPGVYHSTWHKESFAMSLLKDTKLLLEMNTLT